MMVLKEIRVSFTRIWILSIGLAAAQVLGATEEQLLKDQLLRLNLREKFLGVSNLYHSHMAAQLSERSSKSQSESLQRWQVDTLNEFTLPLRIENRSSSFIPTRVSVSLDGVELGSLSLASDTASLENLKWLLLRLKEIPIGERLLKFSLSGNLRGRLTQIDSFQSIFVQGTGAVQPVSVFVDTSLEVPHIRLSVLSLKESQ